MSPSPTSAPSVARLDNAQSSGGGLERRFRRRTKAASILSCRYRFVCWQNLVQYIRGKLLLHVYFPISVRSGNQVVCSLCRLSLADNVDVPAGVRLSKLHPDLPTIRHEWYLNTHSIPDFRPLLIAPYVISFRGWIQD